MIFEHALAYLSFEDGAEILGQACPVVGFGVCVGKFS